MNKELDGDNNDVEPNPEELHKFDEQSMWNEEVLTETSFQQRQVEESVFLQRKKLADLGSPDAKLQLYRDKHISWVLRSLEYLPESAQSLSAAQPWIAFWTLHALDLLGATIPEDVALRMTSHLRKCWDDSGGGFGGGPGQNAHLASTYAAIAALCTIGTEKALQAIDVQGIHRFIRAMKTSTGGFRVSAAGESDVRAMYSALCVASITGILERDPTLCDGCSEYVQTLQSFDGGLGGEPGNEAHGGNTYCGVASMVLMGRLHELDMEALLDWTIMRQMSYEGGFQGRANKLVDSCYSFWVGSLFPLMSLSSSTTPYHPLDTDGLEGSMVSGMFDGEALQKYILQCTQMRRGGFCDKPGVRPDSLHTCYALSGLSLAQQYGGAHSNNEIGVRQTDPVYNICSDKALASRLFFKQ